jgi:hypothetical protein
LVDVLLREIVFVMLNLPQGNIRRKRKMIFHRRHNRF